MKDWLERALKTFVQAFAGIFVPEIIVLLNGGFTDIHTAWKILSPFVAAGLAAGISAVWNMALEKKKDGESDESD